MPVRSLVRTLAVALLCCTAACGDGDDTGECQVAPADDTTDVAGTLVYSVRTVGTAQVHRIVYEGSSGPVTLDTPRIPFELSLQVGAEASVHIQAIGTTESGGSIIAGYRFSDPSNPSPVVTEATCAH